MRYLAFALAAGLLMASAGTAGACNYNTASTDQVLAGQTSDQTSGGTTSQPAKDGKDVRG